MDTDYLKFKYNNTFLYNHNIFKNNYNVGIGTSIPKHTLDIYGNLSSSNNTNIDGSLILNNIYNDELTVLEYNINTTQIHPLKLENHFNIFNNNYYKWTYNNTKLQLDFYDEKDNTIIPFQSIPYKLNENITLYSKYNITLTHVFLYKSTSGNIIEPPISIGVLNNNGLSNNNLTKINEYYYKITPNISLLKNKENNITHNFSEYSVNEYIIFLGTYNFKPGLLWNTNSNKDLLFINKEVSIGTTNRFNTALYINDSVICTNTHVYNKINTYTSEINTINNTGISYLDNISSNSLHINKTQQNIGIGTDKTNDFLDIGGDFIISHNKNTYFNNISFLKNINFKNNINILYKNKPIIIFNNNHNEFTYKLNNIYKSSNTLYILNNLNINNPSNTNNNTNNILTINGNLNVTETISIQGTLKINTLKNITIVKKINVINFKNTNYLLNKGFTYSKYISTNNFKTRYLKLPYKSITTEEGSIYYDNINDNFIGNNGNNLYFLSNDVVKNIQSTFNYKCNGLTQLLYTNTRHINTSNININKKFILPKTSTFTPREIDKDLIGNMQFNVNTLYTEIHNGYNWCSIKYNNTESQLNYISFNNLSELVPPFHNRRFNYEYISIDEPTKLTVSVNPYSVLNMLFKKIIL